jgi:hypothetical protein
MRRPGVRIPLPPVFARVADESGNCRAEGRRGDRRRTFFDFGYMNAASYDSPSQDLRMAKFLYIYVLLGP